MLVPTGGGAKPLFSCIVKFGPFCRGVPSCWSSHQPTCACCRYDQGVTAYIPCNKEWIKKKVSLTQVMLAGFCAFQFTES